LLDQPERDRRDCGVITALLTFAGAGALVVLIPGPDTLVMLRSVVVHGRRSATLTALGILTGLSIWVTAAAIGFTAVLRASDDGYLALRLAGAAYLLYAGVQAFRKRTAGAGTDGESVLSPQLRLVGKGFRAGLSTDLLNPKVGAFFITFLPAFIPHGTAAAPATLGLGAVFVAETAIYFGVMVLFVERLTRWLRNERFRRRLNRATGAVLIGFGIRLAVEG
jgi:threonine/homoserine/homoserine lactone efflux protein